MRFPHFWQRPEPAGGDGGSAGHRDWRESGVADEVEAFLTGRFADQLSARRAPVPAWAALNRLAHADRTELQAVVEGASGGWGSCPLLSQPTWAPSERFVAGNLLARAPTPEALATIQRTTLIPLELRLIERGKVDRMTAEQVLEAGAEALDTYRSDR